MPRFLALDWDAGYVHLLAATAAKGGLKLDRALAWPEEQPPGAGNAAAFGQRVKERLKEIQSGLAHRLARVDGHVARALRRRRR